MRMNGTAPTPPASATEYSAHVLGGIKVMIHSDPPVPMQLKREIIASLDAEFAACPRVISSGVMDSEDGYHPRSAGDPDPGIVRAFQRHAVVTVRLHGPVKRVREDGDLVIQMEWYRGRLRQMTYIQMPGWSNA